MIPDEVVEQVRDAADIVQVIGEYVNLKRVGTDFRGPCPFHQGTHRNFSVSPNKRMYYCFVCKEGGDVFRFLQKRVGVDWPDAVKMVGERSGIEVREVDSRREGPDPREPLWEVNATAAAYFQKILWDDPLGAQARDYLAQRDISREVADQFGIGFAPREIGLLRNYMATLGFDEARLASTGLTVQGEDGSEPRPRFRGRLMFPILDSVGRHIGFGGRIIGPGEPKYLNSPESAAFSKGKTLYGLNWAKNDIRREDQVLVVEGYFDVVRLMTAGVTTVVAPMGTALTEWQSGALRKLTKNVFLLYDSDKAGLQATFRSGDELLRQGASVRVVTLPETEDPDTFVKKHGAAALMARLRDAIDVFEGANRRSSPAKLSVNHVMASAALPFVFPAIRVGREWYGDGGIRLAAPLSAAVHLGATRIIAMSTGYQRSPEEALHPNVRGYPPAAQIISQLVNAVFLDVIDEDVARMERMNEMIRKMPPEEHNGFRPIDLLVLRPSMDLGVLAAEYEKYLPLKIKLITRALGARETESPDFVSLLMFEPRYMKRLIALGEHDIESRLDELRVFFREDARQISAV